MESYTIQLKEIIENGVKIFDFDYPFYDESYRSTFEEHFIEHFYYDEIGQETVARFKQRLKVKFNEIMPYWNKYFMADNLDQRILDNYDVTETFERTSSNNSTSSNSATGESGISDTPVTKTSLDDIDYFSTLEKNKSTNNGNITGTGTEKWTRKMQGNIGVQTDADAIEHYWRTIRKIEQELFNDCNDLFMQIY